MTVPTVACTNCGKNFTTDDLRGTSCRYCGTLLAHHARAQQQVAVVNQMMADRNGNGIPDAYEGIVANAQANAMNQAFGMNPYGPSMMGGPMMGGMNPHAAHNMQVANTVAKTAGTITLVFVIVGVVIAVLTVGIAASVMFLVR
jgi:hypothetical protein